MQKQTLILLCCAILGASAVLCVGIWCASHRYACVAVGSGRAYEVDRLTGQAWMLVGPSRLALSSGRASFRPEDRSSSQLSARMGRLESLTKTGQRH